MSDDTGRKHPGVAALAAPQHTRCRRDRCVRRQGPLAADTEPHAHPAPRGRALKEPGRATGSGKTLAYLLPLIQRLRDEEVAGKVERRIGRPRAAVLAPSRELCNQVLVRPSAAAPDARDAREHRR